MNNKSPEIKKAIESIEIPENKLDNAINLAIKKGNKERVKPRKKRYSFIGVAALAFCLIIGSAFVSPAMAKVLSSIPGFTTVFEFAGDRGLKIASEKGLSNSIEQTVTDQDISLTIQDVFFDGTRLSLGFIQENADMLGELTLKVNGKEINFGDGRSGEHLSDGQYAGVIDVRPTTELPDSFDLSIDIHQIGNVKGTWNFKFPVEKSKEIVQTFKSKETRTYKGHTFAVESVKVGPAGIKVLLELSSPSQTSPLNIGESMVDFNLLNDQGISLTKSGGGGSGDEVDGKTVMRMEYNFAPLEEETAYLTISPFLITILDEAPIEISKPLKLDELPITLNQGGMGEISVTDVTYEEDKTLLYFTVNSDFPFDGHFNNNNIGLVDKNGKDLSSDSKGYAERIKQNDYVQEFQPISKEAPINVVTSLITTLETLKDMEIKIPLK